MENRRKGVALKVVAEILIAIVAAFVILSIFQSLLPSTSESALCRIYRVVLTIPLPSSIMPSISECTIQPKMERFILAETGRAKVVDAIAENIMKCWHEKADDGKSGITFPCYEILIQADDIKEEDVANVFQQKGYCDSLPDNFLDDQRISFSCGNLNKIYWNAGTINGADVTLIIKYNAFQHRIEIVA